MNPEPIFLIHPSSFDVSTKRLFVRNPYRGHAHGGAGTGRQSGTSRGSCARSLTATRWIPVIAA